MGKIVQEKFQEEFMRVPEGAENTGWMSDKSARVKKGIPHGEAGVMLNSLPPGMDIDDQELADIRQQPEIMSGHSDVSHDDPGPGTTKRGFHRRRMRPTDDLYTNEHVDTFYGSIKVEVEDGLMEEGFLERGNMLDRM